MVESEGRSSCFPASRSISTARYCASGAVACTRGSVVAAGPLPAACRHPELSGRPAVVQRRLSGGGQVVTCVRCACIEVKDRPDSMDPVRWREHKAAH